MRTEETKRKVIIEIAEVLNRNSMELETNTPDHVLAESMYMSLEATEKAINGRVDYYKGMDTVEKLSHS